MSESRYLLPKAKLFPTTSDSGFYKFNKRIGCVPLGENHCMFVENDPIANDPGFDVFIINLVNNAIVKRFRVLERLNDVVSLEACGNEYHFIIKLKKEFAGEEVDDVLLYDMREEDPFLRSYRVADKFNFEKRPFIILGDNKHFLSLFRIGMNFVPALFNLENNEDKPEKLFVSVRINIEPTQILLLEDQNCFIGGFIVDQKKLCVWDLNQPNAPIAFIEVPFTVDHHNWAALKIIPLPLNKLLIYDGESECHFYDLNLSLTPLLATIRFAGRPTQLLPLPDGAHVAIYMFGKVEIWSFVNSRLVNEIENDAITTMLSENLKNNFLFVSQGISESGINPVILKWWTSTNLYSYETDFRPSYTYISRDKPTYLGINKILKSITKDSNSCFPDGVSEIVAQFAQPTEVIQQYKLVLPKSVLGKQFLAGGEDTSKDAKITRMDTESAAPDTKSNVRTGAATVRDTSMVLANDFSSRRLEQKDARTPHLGSHGLFSDVDWETARAIEASLKETAMTTRSGVDANASASIASVGSGFNSSAATDEKASFIRMTSARVMAPHRDNHSSEDEELALAIALSASMAQANRDPKHTNPVRVSRVSARSGAELAASFAASHTATSNAEDSGHIVIPGGSRKP